MNTSILHTFGDWFSGLGSFRLALESLGLNCVFSAEIEGHARTTYLLNFGDLPGGDIRTIKVNEMPPQDVICGGWPCQGYSLSGNLEGLNDPRSQLINEVLRAAERMVPQPRVILLENSSNLINVNGGEDLRAIRELFEQIGYRVYHSRLRACDYGAPTIRTRTYIVCLHEDLGCKGFAFPSPADDCPRLRDILLPDDRTNSCVIERNDIVLDLSRDVPGPDGEYPLDTIKLGHIRTGTCQDEVIYSVNGIAPTITHAGGKTSFVYHNNRVRRLHPRECASVMGFPPAYRLICTDAINRSLFGNSACVPVLGSIFRQILRTVGQQI